MNSLIDKSNFIGLDSCTWLFSGAETPTLRRSVEAVNDYFMSRSLGPLGRERNAMIESTCKQNVAKLLCGKAEDIALISNSSDAISIIAQAIPFRQGDNVVINTLEFPSGVLPWLALKKRGVEVRIARAQAWQIEPDDILALVDNRTKLVMTSHVSYMTGARLDYQKLYRELNQTNALLLLDATQSLGVVPVNMEDADFVVCSSYKWLLSIHGAGILGVNHKRLHDIVPVSAGWRSIQNMFSSTRFESFEFHDDARRYEQGFPSYSTVYSLASSTELLLDTGIEKVERHVLELGGSLIERLKKTGFEIMTPNKPSKRAGNISIVCENAAIVADRLQKENIYLWGGDGRLRVSLHLFNDSTDIDKFMELLPACSSNV
ncbi:aminotransferase class V-fold PLP-dependent enzyme [Aneurinibacillus tyrosinisolvens]|uniref:aminotransferase class V-fold PLP-dependent enzyme n=1 Tax=Aneurinibacillus tyrosinisolvens TaxID=1443435 RepID=UPI00063FC5B4|nr:aminotransferase class V-fold PLP-dependent enzyme [Aneurinibacillus tyrosinisolvens]